jgi:hypothetical protein
MLTSKKRPIVLIANHESVANVKSGKVKTPSIVEMMPLPDDCVTVWQTPERFKIIDHVKALARRYRNTLFFVCGGPLSKVLIHHMWNEWPVKFSYGTWS